MALSDKINLGPRKEAFAAVGRHASRALGLPTRCEEEPGGAPWVGEEAKGAAVVELRARGCGMVQRA